MTQMTLAIVRSADIKMTLRLIITVACLQATVFSFAQTEVQKQMMYEHINSFSSPTLASIYPKPEPIPNKEALFKNAQVFPVYKIVFDKINKPKLIQNKNYYLVFYINQLYEFINDANYKSSYLKDSPIVQAISRLKSENKDFKIAYITNTFSLDRKYLNSLIVDPEINTIIERGKTYSLEDFINYKYGSIEKMKELQELDSLREKLKLSDYYDFLKTDYTYFNYNCPKDTTLVLKTLINQVRLATKNFTKGQELKLTDRIIQKLKPFENLKKQLKFNIKSNDSIIKTTLNKLKTKEQEYNKDRLNITGFYEYKVYEVSITNELLEILTTEQFMDYKRYIDIKKPIVETLIPDYNNKYRYTYHPEILIDKQMESMSMIERLDKIFEECGCPYDETVEGRPKRIKMKWKKTTN